MTATSEPKQMGRPRKHKEPLKNCNLKVPQLLLARFDMIAAQKAWNRPQTLEALVDKWEGKTSAPIV
jgi:hypothetical protein